MSNKKIDSETLNILSKALDRTYNDMLTVFCCTIAGIAVIAGISYIYKTQAPQHNYLNVVERANPLTRKNLIYKLNSESSCKNLVFSEVAVKTINNNFQQSIEVNGIGSKQVVTIFGSPVTRDFDSTYFGNVDLVQKPCTFFKLGQSVGFVSAGNKYVNRTNSKVLIKDDETKENIAILNSNVSFEVLGYKSITVFEIQE